jgi:hypothetical protein
MDEDSGKSEYVLSLLGPCGKSRSPLRTNQFKGTFKFIDETKDLVACHAQEGGGDDSDSELNSDGEQEDNVQELHIRTSSKNNRLTTTTVVLPQR